MEKELKEETIVVFHRCGGKSLGYPPNTILTAEWASKYGAMAIEYDIVACKDGEQNKIIIIEPKLLKEANLDINDLKWKDIVKINAGNNIYGYCKVPLLEEMLTLINNSKINHQIHIKGNNPNTIKELLPKLKNLNSYLITSFDILVINKIKNINKSIPVGWIVKPKQEKGSEGMEDLTASISTNIDGVKSYTNLELSDILKEAKKT